MSNYINPAYDKQREWIRSARKNGDSWETITYARSGNVEGLEEFLNNMSRLAFWTPVSTDGWLTIVNMQREEEETSRPCGSSMVTDGSGDGNRTVPTHDKSSWQLYRKKLLEEKQFKPDIVNEIEKTTLRILNRLHFSTDKNKPVKGAVIGNVQSGKTANMAALMAMAADWGWNLFIVLSGTIDNLREQTQMRLFSDLHCHGNINWRALHHLSLHSVIGERAQDLDFNERASDRYFTVCLKNSTQLKKLLEWTQKTPAKQKQMRILLIDDECDQAGINTADIQSGERRRINGLICDIVNGNTCSHIPSQEQFQAMNYVGYTATPYANLLNESESGSMYPRSFISTLSVSKEYFGPQQIFGVTSGEYQGMNIVRTIAEDDLNLLKKTNIYKKNNKR